MFKLMFALTIVFHFSAMACDAFDGSFLCQRGRDQVVKEFKSFEGGFEILTDGSPVTYYTDGLERDVSFPEIQDGHLKAYCQQRNLVTEFRATILDEGDPIAKMKQTTTYTLNGPILKVEQKTISKNIPLPKIKMNCKRI